MWYTKGMLQAFVGIISRRGLESFYLEHEHTARFLQRRAVGQRETSCFWAVIREADAVQVGNMLAAGYRRNALLVLQALVKEMRTYMPDRSCLVGSLVDYQQ